MLAPQRQQAILDRVHRFGGVRVSELVREFGVSDMTIRRDLEALAERGLVDKVHGGATEAGGGVAEAGGQAAGTAAVGGRPRDLAAADLVGDLAAGPATDSRAGPATDRATGPPAGPVPDLAGDLATRAAAGPAEAVLADLPPPEPPPEYAPLRSAFLRGPRGGAAPASTDEPGFAAKSVRQPREKKAIARRAAALVRPGMAVALSAGTTTWALAHRLLDIPRLTVVTNSALIADVFTGSAQTVVLTGGIRTPSDALVGPVAVAAIRSLNVDMLFLGVHGMASGAGFTTPNLMEAETNRAFVAAARNLTVVADHTKWETVGLSTIAQLVDADVLVTDAGLTGEARSTLAAEVGELVVAEMPVRAVSR